MVCTLFVPKSQCPVGPTALRSVAPAQPNERKKQMVRRIARSSFPICSPSFAAPALYQGATRLPGRALASRDNAGAVSLYSCCKCKLVRLDFGRTRSLHWREMDSNSR